MTTIRRFCCNDLLRFSSVNLDNLTETFNMSFYMTYLVRWPDYFQVAEDPGKRIMGYTMGKVEGQGESWHGHVTAVTVAPEYRRQQLAKKLMNLREEISEKYKISVQFNVHLILDNFLLCIFSLIIHLGYVIYRRVLRYYSGEEDGLGNWNLIPNHNVAFFFLVRHIYCILPSISWFVFPDTRKALSRDVEKKSMIPLKRPVITDELEDD